MKKILIIAALLIACNNAWAQTAKLTIKNHTDHAINVTMYGWAPTTCSGPDCNTTYITNTITIPAPTGPPYPMGTRVWGATTPCGVSTGVGWASEACATSWCGSLPSDFQWSLAEIDIPTAYICWGGGIFPLSVCPPQVTCGAATGATDGPHGPSCLYYLIATWSSTGGSLADVTVTVDQY